MTSGKILYASLPFKYRIVFLDLETHEFSWKEYSDVLIAWRIFRLARMSRPKYSVIGLFDVGANEISYRQIQEIRQNRRALNKARRALASSWGYGHILLKDLKILFGELEAIPVPI